MTHRRLTITAVIETEVGMWSPGDFVEFGPFRLFPFERRLVRSGELVTLGGRAFDLLTMLLDRSGQVVSNRDLIAQAWPGISVEDSSLRANIAALRRALGDSDDGARYIMNVARRGYSFVGQVKRTRAASRARRAESPRVPSRRLSRVIGRERELETIQALIATNRLVTIHGTGGVGKTTVAEAAAESLSASFEDGVSLLDFSLLGRGGSVSNVLTAALGLMENSGEPMPGIVGALREREMLLMFDCCEHVVDSAAAAAEAILSTAARVRILATSREPLRADGEHVFNLHPLQPPPEDTKITMSSVLQYPAALLFHNRVVASGHRGGATDADAQAIAAICRKADGIALALEFAAGRVNTHGLVETANLLDGHLKLLWRGLRTAPARHQTLGAMLDWSYELLSPLERIVLCRVSVFVGRFALSDVLAIASSGGVDPSSVADSMARLVEHCLLDVETDLARTYYRLLDSTRSYAQNKLKQSGEETAIARRHAVHCRDRMQTDAGRTPTSGPGFDTVANTRSALSWCFSSDGDASLGMQLVVVSAPHFIDRGLVRESFDWADRALAAMGPEMRGTTIEMELSSIFATASNLTHGNSIRTQEALERGLALAEALGNLRQQFHLLSGQSLYSLRLGDKDTTLRIAERVVAVAAALDEPAPMAGAEVILGAAHHMTGDQAAALRHCERGVAASTVLDSKSLMSFGYDQRIRGLSTLARVQWLRGLPDRATATAKQSISEAQAQGRPVDIANALTHSTQVLIWAGDLDAADAFSEMSTAHAAKHSLRLYEIKSLVMQGQVLVERGRLDAGIELMRDAYAMLDVHQHQMDASVVLTGIAEALVRDNRAEEAAVVFEDVERLLRGGSWPYYACEIMRVKAAISLRLARADMADGQALLLRALDLARQQSTRAWELRCSTTLAHLWAGMRRLDDARTLLSEIYRKFEEGFETADLKASRTLLEQLANGADFSEWTA